jgi:hypothetical protein
MKTGGHSLDGVFKLFDLTLGVKQVVYRMEYIMRVDIFVKFQ